MSEPCDRADGFLPKPRENVVLEPDDDLAGMAGGPPWIFIAGASMTLLLVEGWSVFTQSYGLLLLAKMLGSSC